MALAARRCSRHRDRQQRAGRRHGKDSKARPAGSDGPLGGWRTLTRIPCAADAAFFRQTPAGTYELAASLSTSEEVEALAELESLADMGVRTLEPGTYVTACAKGAGPPCPSADDERVVLERDGILLFRYGSSARLRLHREDGSHSSRRGSRTDPRSHLVKCLDSNGISVDLEQGYEFVVDACYALAKMYLPRRLQLRFGGGVPWYEDEPTHSRMAVTATPAAPTPAATGGRTLPAQARRPQGSPH